MKKQVEGQLALDFTTREEVVPSDICKKYLHETYLCDNSIDHYVDRLFKEFPRPEAFDRAKCLELCSGKTSKGISLGELEHMGLYDHSIDYHTMWDRCWAVRKGWTYHDAEDIIYWDYTKNEPSETLTPRCIREKEWTFCTFAPCCESQGIRCCSQCELGNDGCKCHKLRE